MYLVADFDTLVFFLSGPTQGDECYVAYLGQADNNQHYIAEMPNQVT
jgi:hypothetical protein